MDSQNASGRLGLPATFLRTRTIEGGLPSPTLLTLPNTVLDISAGGWSFHAITTANVQVWGTMDGEDFAPPGDLALPGAVVGEPIILPGSEGLDIVSLKAGRKHAIALNSDSQVYEYYSFGGIYQVRSQSWGNEMVAAVEAGWGHSAVLTSSGNVFIWSEFDVADITPRSGALPIVTTDTTRLPTAPRSPTTSQADKFTKIACGVNFIVALTQQSHVYYLDISPIDPVGRMAAARTARLEAAFVSGERSWIFLERFCDVPMIQALPEFDAITISPAARITHISAHFHSFAAYSVPLDSKSSSIVLLGDDHDVTAEKAPQVIPELQGIGVIKIVQGDYSFGALTSDGRLRTWGQYSGGALGLGHPSLLNTPLTHPSLRSPAPTPPVQSSSQSNLFPLPQITPRLPIAPVIHYRSPDSVAKPTVVLFGKEPSPIEGNAAEPENRTSGKFVVSATMSGFHTAAIAVELGEREDGEEVVPEEVPEAAESTGGLRTGIFPTMRGGRLPFRLGYAARGMHRGPGDGGL